MKIEIKNYAGDYNEDAAEVANVPWSEFDTEDEDGFTVLIVYVQAADHREDYKALIRIQGAIEAALHETSTGQMQDEPSENENGLFWVVNDCLRFYEYRKITTLLYKSLHKSTSDTVEDEISAFDSKECQELRALIGTANPALAEYTEENFRDYLSEKETEEEDYFGECISDDSDMEDEELSYDERKERRGQRKKTARVLKQDPAAEDVLTHCMTTKLRSAFKVNRKRKRPGANPVPVDYEVRDKNEWSPGATENAQIHYPEGKDDPWTKEALEDLDIVNAAIARGDLNVDSLTSTKFCIAQYRGISYNTTVFNTVARRQSREKVELRLPVFSSYVFAAAGINPGTYYAGGVPEDQDAELVKLAEELKACLVAKRFSEPLNYGNHTFACHADALQNEYTREYHAFFDSLKAYLLEKEAEQRKLTKKEADFIQQVGTKRVGKTQTRELWPAFEGLAYPKNFYVSTGNTPRHALRYAYGIKYYGGHGHTRLRPRWRQSGRAERPYSGKVYVSLHPISDYVGSGPMDVVALNRAGKTHIDAMVAYERECSFSAYIPADRIIAEHIARYPSFIGKHKKAFEQKYGLVEDDYRRFRECIMGNAPHTDKHKTAKHALGEWLVRYHEARLVELARRMAWARGMLLVYRDENGFLARALGTKVRPIKTKGARSSSAKDRRSSSRNVLDTQPPKDAIGYTREALLRTRGWKLRLELIRDAEQRASRLRAWISERFDIFGTPMDGNCLFHAISRSFAQSLEITTTHAQLRTTAVQYLHDNNERYQLAESYLTAMATPACPLEERETLRKDDDALQHDKWGGDREIEALAHSHGVAIRVYAPSHPHGYSTYNPGEDEIPSRLGAILYHVGGNHWVYLQPKRDNALQDDFDG